jgi:hypothetical protein
MDRLLMRSRHPIPQAASSRVERALRAPPGGKPAPTVWVSRRTTPSAAADILNHSQGDERWRKQCGVSPHGRARTWDHPTP